MSHDLEMLANGQAAMMYNMETGVPWHNLGEGVQGVQTAEEAIRRANLNWGVEKRPVYSLKSDGSFEAIPDRFETMRTTDEKTLGVVGKDYKPIQNSEAFEFFDNLVDSGEAKYDTAGSLGGGKRIWLTAQVGDDIQVAGQDSHRLYLALLSSHDGSKSLTALTTMVRIVCANTEQMALRSAKTSWTMTHRQSLQGKVAEAREALQLSFKYRDEFDKEMQKMLSVKVSVDEFQSMMKEVLPKQKRQLEKNLTVLTGIYENSPTIKDAGLSGTGMGAYNAVTEWLTWGREVRSQEARMVNSLWGFGQQTRNKTHELIMAKA
jgi:phage/plasmid-like protein (TIGR03299 family)